LADSDKIGLKEAISIGIGGMVGGGIFAVLGLAVSLAKGGTPVAFLFAGVLALLTAASYSKLSKAYPDSGGTVRFINEGFGKSIFSGAANNLLWLSYIIMLSLYAAAFGSYAPNLFALFENHSANYHLYASAIVVLATIINYYSISVVGKIESIAVVIKLVILLSFVGIGAYGLIGNNNLSQLSLSHWENPIQLFAGGMVIFVAYEGFELIANSVPNLKDPGRNISKAYFYSVIFVILLYIIIAIVTVGSLPFNKIADAKDYVLAEAARPMLGKPGFTIITIAALISTFSAINATIYGGSRVNYEIARDDELPHHFLSRLWNQPIGLLITSVCTLVLVNTLRLESISAAGSIGFLLIFCLVNFVAVRKSSQIGSKKFKPLLGCILCFIALLVLIGQQWQTEKTGIIVAAGIILFCILSEFIFKRWENRKTSTS